MLISSLFVTQLENDTNVILADEMGLGKTVQIRFYAGFFTGTDSLLLISDMHILSCSFEDSFLSLPSECSANIWAISRCGPVINFVKLGQGIQEVAS